MLNNHTSYTRWYFEKDSLGELQEDLLHYTVQTLSMSLQILHSVLNVLK